MFKGKFTILMLVLMAITTIIYMMVGCESSPVSNDAIVSNNTYNLQSVYNENETENNKFNIITGENSTIVQEVLLDACNGKNIAISSALNDDNVTSGHVWLVAQGYSFIDYNSVVVIEREYKLVENPVEVKIDFPSANKQLPDVELVQVLVRADTIVWQAFENPTHDSANHTALVTYWGSTNTKRTMIFELDVSTEIPTVIREGDIIGGKYVPDDNETTVFLECLAAGALATNVSCIWSNCGYGHCAAAGYAGTLAGCAVLWAFSL